MGIASNFRKQLFKRRIPQIFGFYLAGSWTALEFTQWAVERYSLSSYWEEVLVLTLLLLLPIILVSAWHHGAPGKQSWGKFEKIFIPLNLLIIPIVLFNTYSIDNFKSSVESKNNSATIASAGNDSTAEPIENIIPIAFFPFTNISQDPKLNNLAIVSAEILDRDMSQNNHISSINALFHLFNDLSKSQINIDAIPLSMQINLAKKKGRTYFANGTLDFVNNKYQIIVKLYSSLSGKVIHSFSVENTNYFSAIDKVTEKLQQELLKDFSDVQTDLPIGDLYTDNLKAFEFYSQGRVLLTQYTKHEEGISNIEKAIEEEPSFAFANFFLANLYLQLSQVEKAKKYLSNATKYRSVKFTERERFSLTINQLLVDKQMDKLLGVIEQWIESYPNDSQPYEVQAQIASLFQKHELSIQAKEKLLEIDPSRGHLWSSIGDSYFALGDYDNALVFYKKNLDLYPKKIGSYLKIGNYYLTLGNFDSAITFFQKALNINPQHVSSLTKVADANARLGNFIAAENGYKKAVAYAQTPLEKSRADFSLAQLYWLFGQLSTSTEHYKKALQEFSTITTSLVFQRTQAQFASIFHLAGEKEYAWSLINNGLQLASEMNEPVHSLDINIFKSLLLNLEGRTEESIKLVKTVSKEMRTHIKNTMDEELSYYLGLAHFHNEEYNKAIELFAPVTIKHPNNPVFLEKQAEAYYLAQNYENAYISYERMLQLSPGYPTYNLGMAKVLIKQNKHSLAQTFLNKAIEGWSFAEEDYAKLVEAKQLLHELGQ